MKRRDALAPRPSPARQAGASSAALLLWLAFGAPVSAKCQDAPKPGVDWTGCSQTQLMLADDNLTGAVFVKAVLNSTDFAKSKLANAKFDEAEVSFTRFEGADLTGASFVKAVGWRANFNKANLQKANFQSAQMSRATFAQSKLTGANFSKSEVNRSDFTGADLTGVDMSKAELARVAFGNAKLAHANFSYSNLARARLSGAHLEAVDLAGAYLFLTQLRGADLTHATGLTQDQLEMACGSAETKLPKGLAQPKSWPCSGDDD